MELPARYLDVKDTPIKVRGTIIEVPVVKANAVYSVLRHARKGKPVKVIAFRDKTNNYTNLANLKVDDLVQLEGLVIPHRDGGYQLKVKKVCRPVRLETGIMVY